MEKITSARVIPPAGWGDKSRVLVTVGGEECELFTFFSDELNFGSSEFIGLTIDEGRALFHKKDVAYLRS